MTAKVQPHEIKDTSDGANDVISKPFDPLSLPATILKIWERTRAASCYSNAKIADIFIVIKILEKSIDRQNSIEIKKSAMIISRGCCYFLILDFSQVEKFGKRLHQHDHSHWGLLSYRNEEKIQLCGLKEKLSRL